MKLTPNRIMKTATTHCMYGEKLNRLSFLAPKPPVPAVASPVLTDSKRVIPPKSRRMISRTVIAK